MNYAQVLENAKSWALEMGSIQLKHFRKNNLKVETKSSIVDLVTEVDKACEKYVLYQISSHYPDHGILSEESGSNNKKSDYQWVIDPLDGTTNFSQGIPVFAVSIALNYKDETVLGAVYLPNTDELFTAIKGEGAYLNSNELLSVSTKTEFEESILVTGFPYDRRENPNNNASIFSQVVPLVRGIRRDGSAASNLAYIAAGFTDCFWELNLSLWDVAAGLLLITEAGGVVEYLPEHRGVSLIAGNEVLVDSMSSIIKEIGVL